MASSPAIVEASGPLTFVVATLDTLSDWRFEPATLEGEPVAVYFRITVHFTPR